MKLYEIANEYREIFDQLSEITELNDEVISDTLSPVKSDFNDKAISLTSWFRNLEAEAKAIKKAEKMMNKRRKALEKKVEDLKKYLKHQMAFTGINKIKCPYFSVTLSDIGKKVQINNKDNIPKSFLKEKITYVPDTDAIMEAGGCEGAEIVKSYRLTIK